MEDFRKKEILSEEILYLGTEPKKKKPTKLDWRAILIGAVVDLIVGTILILIAKLIG